MEMQVCTPGWLQLAAGGKEKSQGMFEVGLLEKPGQRTRAWVTLQTAGEIP